MLQNIKMKLIKINIFDKNLILYVQKLVLIQQSVIIFYINIFLKARKTMWSSLGFGDFYNSLAVNKYLFYLYIRWLY